MSARQTKRPAPLSLRLSAEERARLERDAAGLSLSAYIKERLFAADAPRRITRGKAPVKDHQLLGRLLGQLGSSRVANSLNQLAQAAHAGSLPLTPDVELSLKHACADIAAMRNALMQALGMQEHSTAAELSPRIAAFRGCAKPTEVPR